MILHANAVAENCASGVRTGGIDRDDASRASLLAVELRELVDQRALAGAGRTRKSEHAGLAGVGKQCFEQFRVASRAILDRTDDARQGTGITGTQPSN